WRATSARNWFRWELRRLRMTSCSPRSSWGIRGIRRTYSNTLLTVRNAWPSNGLVSPLRPWPTSAIRLTRIAAAAKESEAALVVMATHGRSGLARTAFGSGAGGVLAHDLAPLVLRRA